jgi:RNA polymerase sigma factor (sigma-70 family)
LSALRSGQEASVDSDHHLVAAVRRGDDQAFGELYSRYGRRIVSYVFGMLGDHGRAEDVAQEVFISALRRMRATERPIAFKPWIYEIARNACIDEFRRTRRAREVPLGTDDESEGPECQLESRTASPDAALERRQQLDDLRGAFRGLSESHHKIIVLRELEGLSYTEIGRRLGMSRPVVESTLFRARRRLGTEYQEIASGRRCEQVHAVIEAGGEKAVRALGIRERRRVSRHVAHCQPCRRYAHLAGVDDSVLKAPGLVEKIAALLPIPAFLRRRRGGADHNATASESPSARILQSMPTVSRFADPASPLFGLGRAAAVVAAAVVAGGGVLGTLSAVGGAAPSAKHPVARHVSSAPGESIGRTAAAPVVAAGRAASAKRTTAAPTKSAPGAGGTSTSQAGRTVAGGSSTPASSPSASQSRSSAPAGGSTETSGAATSSHTTASQPSSAATSSSSSSAPLPQVPQVPQPPAGQSGSPLPSPPQISSPKVPQPPNLNLPSPPSVNDVIGKARNLVP